MGSVMAQMDGWIASIGVNPTIIANGQLPVKVRQPSDSTNGGVTNGFGYRFPDTTIGLNADGPDYPHLIIHGTETSLVLEVGDEYEDDTQNGGFGNMAATPGHYSLQSMAGDAGFNNEAIVAYDTTNGQEFFGAGFRTGNAASKSGAFVVFKDTDGHWCFMVEFVAFAYDTILNYWVGFNGPYDTDPAQVYTTSGYYPLTIRAGTIQGVGGKSGYDGSLQSFWYANNPALYSGRYSTDQFGDFTRINNDTEAVISLGYTSSAVRVTI